MSGRTEQGQFIVAPGDHLQNWILQLALDQADVQLEVANPAGDGGGVFHRQADAGVRVQAHEVRHDRYGQIVADGQRGAHFELRHVGPLRQAVLELARLCQQRLRSGTQRFAQLAQLHALAGTVEELNVEALFQILQRRAGGRLRHRETVRRLGDIFVMRGREEDFNLPQGVMHALFLFRD